MLTARRRAGMWWPEWLVGPGAKQRYLYAQTLTDQMKQGMSESERIQTTDRLIELLDKYVHPEEGQVQNFVLLALGRVWEGTGGASPEAIQSQQKAVQTLILLAFSPLVALLFYVTRRIVQ